MATRRGRFLLALCLSLWFLGGCTAGPPEPSPLPAPAPGTTDSLERTVLHFLEDGVTSVVVQVRWPGGEWSKAYGVRNLSTNDPARPLDRFPAGGLTQSMVAAEVLKLVDEHRLSLDGPINDALARVAPELKPPGVVTLRQLLNHTSGLPDFSDESFRGSRAGGTLQAHISSQDGLRLAARLPWESFNTGFFNYSESNYLALGLLIEDARSRPLDEILQNDLFRPMGMEKTTLSGPDRGARDNLHGYVMDGNRQVDVTQADYLVGSPAGGVVSTTADINNFYRSLLSGRIASPGLVREMKETGNGNYGLGLQRFSIGCSGEHRYGSTGRVFGYLSASISSDDGGSQVTMGLALPPLPVDDPVADRRIGLYASQMVSAAQETLDHLCQ
ncbi:serine hydrolase domain-containing protein [Paenarthrobacter sp. NPDC090522]|uniref:serine hydrolase domain-containing protein n=1 Tax=Paenarthrobacter sp. NPDC090522 TaxID=3364383 RepID=UPI00380ECF16